MTGKVCVNLYFLFLKVSVFQERFFTFTNFNALAVEFNFYLFMTGFSEKNDSHVNLPFSFKSVLLHL